jgi:hypothetical protein
VNRLQTPAYMRPRAGIEVGIGRRLNPARDAKQQAEGVERVEPSVEAERELIAVLKAMLGERIGGVAQSVAGTVAKAATLAVSAPMAIVDTDTRETLGDEVASLGESTKSIIAAPVRAVSQ